MPRSDKFRTTKEAVTAVVTAARDTSDDVVRILGRRMHSVRNKFGNRYDAQEPLDMMPFVMKPPTDLRIHPNVFATANQDHGMDCKCSLMTHSTGMVMTPLPPSCSRDNNREGACGGGGHAIASPLSFDSGGENDSPLYYLEDVYDDLGEELLSLATVAWSTFVLPDSAKPDAGLVGYRRRFPRVRHTAVVGPAGSVTAELHSSEFVMESTSCPYNSYMFIRYANDPDKMFMRRVRPLW